MKETAGDLWSFHTLQGRKYVCIATNGIVSHKGLAVMGRGTALQAAKRYPELPKLLGQKLLSTGNQVCLLAHHIIAFPTKQEWWNDSSLDRIERSLIELTTLAETLQATTVYLPRPGCGYGNLNWADVRPLCEGYLDDRFHIVQYIKGTHA